MDTATRHATASPSTLQFGDRTLDLASGVLRDGSGATVPIRPQAWQVLRLLVQRRGSVVTKDELLDAVWPDVVVTDASLAQAISDARVALQDAGHELIRTVPKRGYMLAAAPADGPPAPPAAAPALPAIRTRLFGRGDDLAALLRIAREHRLVTVIGAGGVGKTVLALNAAHAWAGSAPAAWLDLSRIQGAQLLPAAFAHALGVPLGQQADPLPALRQACRDLDLLLVVDNGEHLVEPLAALVRQLLDAAPALRVLVTSQVPLRLDDERLLRLGGLPLPERDADLDAARRNAAVMLFVDRAQADDHRFELTTDNVGPTVRLCIALEGLPLALRLAAARVSLLGVAGVEARLHERLQLLGDESRDAPSRQRTLLAALEWSHGLLPPDEQALFRQLGTFVGGFTLELAAMACEGDAQADVAARLDSLVARSLVDRVPGDRPRYRLLETQRAYALRLLGASETERTLLHGRHASAVARMMVEESRAMAYETDATWVPRMRPELDNVRSAMDWSVQHDPAIFASLVGSSPFYFRMFDLSPELRRRADAFDEAMVGQLDARDQARYWLARGMVEMGALKPRTYEYLGRAERAATQAADRWLTYMTLCMRGSLGRVSVEEGEALLSAMSRLDMPDWPTRTRSNQAIAECLIHMRCGRWEAAVQAAERGVAFARAGGTVHGLSMQCARLIQALAASGNVAAALRRSEELWNDALHGPAWTRMAFHAAVASAHLLAGDLDAARRRYAEFFELLSVSQWSTMDSVNADFFQLAMLEGRYRAAARLLGRWRNSAPHGWGAASWEDHGAAALARLSPHLAGDELEQLAAQGALLCIEDTRPLVMDPSADPP